MSRTGSGLARSHRSRSAEKQSRRRCVWDAARGRTPSGIDSVSLADDERGMEAAAAPMRYYLIPHSFLSHPPFSILPYGIAGLGTGLTPQTALAQGGSFGVGIRNSLPCVLAEPPFMQVPVKVSLLL
jgi:hypothetical protein